MSNKAELQRIVNEIGYELGPFTSKDTLSNIVRLHSIVRDDFSFDFESFFTLIP
jgi:hypothetical protein